MEDQYTIIDVHVLLLNDDHVLLIRRRGAYGDGMWHLPSGKLDPHEALPAGAAREAHEEVGVLVDPEDLEHAAVLHVANSGPTPRLGVFFHTRRWTGTPTNREPEKCAGIDWFPLHDLPDNVIPYPLAGIRAFTSGTPFAVIGWDDSPSSGLPRLVPERSWQRPCRQ
ncbi:NUDIX hydrolase [Actinokineospora spheciospongiae]|uniref:NUDIX hydrolase n=1 Tax=Actinokineospora spheciospongiae TaxID=909613 RepID=UPI000D71938C|nr:NUDIX domain-containing protein [Actinokineospora spheciospongiae]PWW67042.1 ADP-ribose pyrophosphatase YjhB (NUDIX family) [Actinokineospora spheciospongiae]